MAAGPSDAPPPTEVPELGSGAGEGSPSLPPPSLWLVCHFPGKRWETQQGAQRQEKAEGEGVGATGDREGLLCVVGALCWEPGAAANRQKLEFAKGALPKTS